MTKSNRFDTLAPVAFLMLAVVYTMPFLLKLTWWGVRDWDLFTAVAAAPVRTVLDFGQAPFWNPWMAGGNILFHHPEVGVVTPFFVINLICGVVVGMKLQVLLCYWLGFWGSYRMGRALGQSQLASLLLSVSYFGSVHFAMHFAEGHMPFTHFAFLPWFLEGILRYNSSLKYLLLSVVSLALMILGNGGAVPFLYTVLFCGLSCLLLDIHLGSARLMRVFIMATTLGVCLAAVKFVPMVLYLKENTWTGNSTESIPFAALGDIFFGWDQSIFSQNFDTQLWGWHEYGAYVLPLVVALAVWISVRRITTMWPWVVVTMCFFTVGLGDFGEFSPWKVLSHLPGFDALRCSGRAFQFVILGVSILAGFGLDDMLSRSRSATGNVAGGMCVTAVLIVNLWLCLPILSSAFTTKPMTPITTGRFEQSSDRDKRAYELFLENKGALITPQLSAYHPSRALVGPGDKIIPEFVVSGSATVILKEMTPNKMTYRLQSPHDGGGGRMAISMGYDRGWQVTSGDVTDFSGVISFPFQPGNQTITLTYTPPGFWIGTVISIATLISCMLVIRRRE